MPTFLLLLQEDDLEVKNVALLMVYSAVHHTPQLVAGIMKEQVLPTIYELAQLNMERKVDLGPFKHTVDDALPLRKAALSIVATCLEKCPSCIDIPAFMPVLAKAMADVEDIQLQAHQIVISMCSRQPIPLVAAADSFVEPLEKTVNKKKGNKTGVSVELFASAQFHCLIVLIPIFFFADGTGESVRVDQEWTPRDACHCCIGWCHEFPQVCRVCPAHQQ